MPLHHESFYPSILQYGSEVEEKRALCSFFDKIYMAKRSIAPKGSLWHRLPATDASIGNLCARLPGNRQLKRASNGIPKKSAPAVKLLKFFASLCNFFFQKEKVSNRT